MKRKKKYAIIGLGFISHRHIEAIKRNNGKLVWVCDIDARHKIRFDKSIKFTKDYRRIRDVDYVAICTPNDLHAPIIKHFLAKGIKVIVEKPPVTVMSDFYDLQDEDVNVILQLRHHPEMKELKEKAKGGGHKVQMDVRVKRDKAYWEDWKGDRSRSGGILLNIGIHYMDALLHCFKGEYKILYANVTDTFAQIRLAIGTNEVAITIQIMPDNLSQTREIVVDGKKFQFSCKDNLAFEGLHTQAYKAILDDKGTKIKECGRVLGLIDLLNFMYV